MSLSSLKVAALAEIAKIENAAVAEYLTLKTGHYSAVVVLVAAAIGFVIGVIAV